MTTGEGMRAASRYGDGTGTRDPAGEGSRFVATGVDGFVGDHPDRVIEALR